jgi:ubiquinone/menaquinone biosynthesis C-methylase UbiE
MFDKTFCELEHAAWLERASYYDDLFASISSQSIDDILGSVYSLRGKQHLDVACGTGHLVAAANRRGTESIGVDLAETMIAIAKTNYPGLNFRVADGTQLPFEDASFDFVTCSFGLSHMVSPEQAIAEAYRVLRAGGVYAFTLWNGDDEQGLQALVQPAVEKYAQPIALPQQWTQLRFADKDQCASLTADAGFARPTFKCLPIVAQLASPQIVLDLVDKLSVRTTLMLDQQTDAIREQIYQHIRDHAEALQVDGVIKLDWHAMLVIVHKPQ